MSLYQELIKRTHRIPKYSTTLGNGKRLTRQLDATLLSAGFKLSGEAMLHLSKSSAATVRNVSFDILQAVHKLVGDHVQHNVYFKEFPKNVPDTEEFWFDCIADALQDPITAAKIVLSLGSIGTVNLLDLPKYGRYQHTYEEMLKAHDQFIPSIKDRVTILHLGDTFEKEIYDMYLSLATSNIPLNEADIEFLKELTSVCLDEKQPEKFPVRENKAIVNQVRFDNYRSLLIDTPTDILRLACALSDGDVTLTEKTKFKSFDRGSRKALLDELDYLVAHNPAKLADVNQYREQWKRLSERLHPYDYPKYKEAHKVFAVARRELRPLSFMGKFEKAMADEDYVLATYLLKQAPGMLFRNLDRLMCFTDTTKDAPKVLEAVLEVAPKVSGRVLLSVREHLYNRTFRQQEKRIFINKKGTSWVADDERPLLDSVSVDLIGKAIDEEITSRLPNYGHIVMDKAISHVTVPLSNKHTAKGYGVFPRGSVTSINGNNLRFFVYWHEKGHETTDYDLSTIFLNHDFHVTGQVSYTNLRADSVVHSGDLVQAPQGATEFIDINLNSLASVSYIIPQINIYSGEPFDEVGEAFFGYMSRTPEQKGKPFEPKTVKLKCDLSGKGKVALPVMFYKGAHGWQAKWLNMFMKGYPRYNATENNRMTTALVTSAIKNREYMPLDHLVSLMIKKSDKFTWYSRQEFDHPVTYIGLEAPENLPKDSKVFTLNNLHELCPE